MVFSAPWGRSLKVTTTIVVGILIVIPIIGLLIKLPQTLLLHKPVVGIIVLYSMILIPITILFLLCQFVFSWIFAHHIELKQDRIVAIGPWSVKHSIGLNEIRTIIFNDSATVLQKKFGINKIYISKSIDPNRDLHNSLLKRVNGKNVKIVGNAII